ncbi:MAG TPA: hypothetical protein VIF36_03160 [Gaiellaceae bacterium]
MRLLRPALLTWRRATIVLALAAFAPATAAAHPGHATGGLEGTIQVVHSDDFAHRRARFGYELLSGGRRLVLKGADRKLARLAGSRVRISGRLRGNALTVRSLHTVRTAAGFHSLSDGPRETAVVLLNFASAPSEPFTADRAREVVFTGPGSVDAYYREQSFGQVSLTGRLRADGDVFGWLTIADTTAGCDYRGWSTSARALALAQGTDLRGYAHVVYVFPYVAACGWAGLGELPGDESWVNGELSLRVIGHELGHNLGVHHANALRCTDGVGQGLALADTDSCTQTEYGDPLSIMGSSASRHMNAWQKAHLGWVSGAGVRTISASGSYSVWPVGWLVPGPQLLRIARGDGTYLYVDFRRPYRTFFETFSASSAAVNGVSLRIAPDLTSYVQSALIDAKPITHSLEDAPLLPGRSLEDPLSGVSVYLQEVSPWKAQLQITMPSGGAPPPAPSDVSAPTAASGLSATASAATSVQLSWTASADNVGVAGYWVYRDGRVVGAPTGATFTDDTTSGQSSYAYTVRSYDAAGNVGPESAVAAVTTPVDAPDTTPPTAPGRLNAVMSSLVYLWWDASFDAGGLSAYVVYRDGVEIGTTSSPSFSDLGVVGGRRYTYSVHARDRAGNLGAAAELVVTLQGAPAGTPPTGDSLANPPAVAPSLRQGRWAGERLLVSVRNGRLPRPWLSGVVRPGRR